MTLCNTNSTIQTLDLLLGHAMPQVTFQALAEPQIWHAVFYGLPAQLSLAYSPALSFLFIHSYPHS